MNLNFRTNTKKNLRLREEVRAHPDECPTARAQFLEDERLALMMQNEEFHAGVEERSRVHVGTAGGRAVQGCI